MAVNGLQPFIKVTDSNGLPIVGAKLHVYEAGTTTYRAIYSNEGLSVSITNPLNGSNASNASGDFPRFYMASGTYKLRAETAAGALIWEYDNIDTGISAGSGGLPVASGGTGATTAAAARTNLDVPSNSELAALASDIAALNSSVQNIASLPQGRLTLTTGTPVLSSDVVAATTVYYTAYNGNLVPVYDGASFVLRSFPSDLALTLNSNHVAGAHYDVFTYWDGAALQIATGPAWNTATASLGARGAGAGTTEITRTNGLLVNRHDMSFRNGSTTGTIDVNRGTFLGSIYMDGSAGQVTCHVSYGQSRKWGVWNAYNRRIIKLLAGDPTATWSYTTDALRAANGAAANCLDIFSGLPEEWFDIEYSIFASGNLASNKYFNPRVGIGYNSATVASGKLGRAGTNTDSGNVINILPSVTVTAKYDAVPTIGYNRITALEGNATSDNVTWNGTSSYMLLSATWWG